MSGRERTIMTVYFLFEISFLLFLIFFLTTNNSKHGLVIGTFFMQKIGLGLNPLAFIFFLIIIFSSHFEQY